MDLFARRGYFLLRVHLVPDDFKASFWEDFAKGIVAIGRLAKFSPWIAGDTFTQADLVGYFSFVLAAPSARENTGIDLLEQLPGAKAWYAAVEERASVKQAQSDRDEFQKRMEARSK